MGRLKEAWINAIEDGTEKEFMERFPENQDPMLRLLGRPTSEVLGQLEIRCCPCPQLNAPANAELPRSQSGDSAEKAKQKKALQGRLTADARQTRPVREVVRSTSSIACPKRSGVDSYPTSRRKRRGA